MRSDWIVTSDQHQREAHPRKNIINFTKNIHFERGAPVVDLKSLPLGNCNHIIDIPRAGKVKLIEEQRGLTQKQASSYVSQVADLESQLRVKECESEQRDVVAPDRDSYKDLANEIQAQYDALQASFSGRIISDHMLSRSQQQLIATRYSM